MSAERRSAVNSTFLEGLLVVVIGVIFALAANRISPRGLMLARNYFPGETRPLVFTNTAAGTNSMTPAQRLAAILKEKGLQLIDTPRAAQLFQDPRHSQGIVVFIDARDEQRYQAGHIPGAYELDPYRPEKYFAAALPVCQAAEQIVVYCNGGDCDDSETAAILLRDIGIANQKLLVYGGGITEWTTNGLPVEVGGRNSGDLRHYGK